MIFFSELSALTGGKPLLLHKDGKIEAIAIDSRKAAPQPGMLFFAIRGERHDGHAYIPALYHAGIRQFVVEDSTFQADQFPEANILLVRSAVDALQKIAATHRGQFSFPVIGITGSNGKTIVKEWLFQMLSKDQVIVKNPGSFNSQVGVPLSVWQMQSHHQLGIFEAGISRPGEMDNLEKVIKPTIGIFTNIGSAHDEGFESQAEKISEKLKLFKNSKVLIYCADQESVRTMISSTGISFFSWGKEESNDVIVSTHGQTGYVTFKQQEHILNLPFSDNASVENCLHCVAVMLYMGYPFKVIQRGINGLRSVPMRMEMKEGINQSYIIDDTYNNDLGGLELSLQFLSHQNQKRKKQCRLAV